MSAPVAIVMGSQSDWPTLRHAAEMLDTLKIEYEARIVSAHRTPDRLYEFILSKAQPGRANHDKFPIIAGQWKTIERLQKKLDALAERFLALEEQTAPDIPVTKPPHW